MKAHPAPPDRDVRHTILMIVMCLLPLLLLVLVLASGMPLSPWLFVLFLLLCFAGMYYVMGSHPAAREHEEATNEPPDPVTKDVPEGLILRTVDVIYPQSTYRLGNHYVIEGPLLLRPDAAYEALRRRFAGSELTPLLQESTSGRPALVLVPARNLRAQVRQRPRTWLNGLLFAATLLTMTWAGATHQGYDVLAEPARFASGLPYALALAVILGAHELGHYFTARRYSINVSLPYFIPVPFALGTFGAFIQMKSLAPDRRAAFDVAVAGPLSGLLVAVPALLIGLRFSFAVPEAVAPGMMGGGADAGSSVLLAFLAKAVLGDAVLEGHRLVLHPVAFAGWLGLLVTALNLIPVGQLDGGHMVRALLGGPAARLVGIVSLLALVVLGLFVWSGLLMWALIIFFIAGTADAPPLNDVSRLDRRRVVVGAFAFALLLLILLPVPHALYGAFGLHCPYA